jgi:hypothetical protein
LSIASWNATTLAMLGLLVAACAPLAVADVSWTKTSATAATAVEFLTFI